jgi:hypothetical protein
MSWQAKAIHGMLWQTKTIQGMSWQAKTIQRIFYETKIIQGVSWQTKTIIQEVIEDTKRVIRIHNSKNGYKTPHRKPKIEQHQHRCWTQVLQKDKQFLLH